MTSPLRSMKTPNDRGSAKLFAVTHDAVPSGWRRNCVNQPSGVDHVRTASLVTTGACGAAASGTSAATSATARACSVRVRMGQS